MQSWRWCRPCMPALTSSSSSAQNTIYYLFSARRCSRLRGALRLHARSATLRASAPPPRRERRSSRETFAVAFLLNVPRARALEVAHAVRVFRGMRVACVHAADMRFA